MAVRADASVQMISAPASVELGDLESDELIYGFHESSADNLASVYVDAVTTGSAQVIDSAGDLSSPRIEISGPFESWMFHFDPVGIPSPAEKTTGTMSFTDKILGIIVTDQGLDDSDGVGAPGTDYPAGVQYRGLEWGGQDQVTLSISGDDKTISFDFLKANTVMDQVRVITESGAKAIPEPATFIVWSILGTLAITVGWWRRRRPA